MGTFLFKWTHPANEVHVTGTFDNWSKSVQLEKKDGVFQKLVTLPSAAEKIYYKFVVDGEWTTDHTAPKETDASNNVNNVLSPERIQKPGAAALGAAAISGVTSGATTTGLAAQVPKESDRSQATKDVPGDFPKTPTQEDKQFGIKPIPATAGLGNPISLAPGENVPDASTLTNKNTTTADTLDKESYEKAGSSQIVPPSSSVAVTQGGMFGVLPVGRGVIPESSIPMGAGAPTEDVKATPTIQSAGAGSTAAALAANVPKEPRGTPQVISGSTSSGGDKSTAVTKTVPTTVEKSISQAHTSPEAAADPAAVKEKAAVEKELLQDVKKTDAAGAPAPTASAATAASAPTPTKEKSLAAKAATAAAHAHPTAKDKERSAATNNESAATPGTPTKTRASAVKDKAPDVTNDSRDISPMSHPEGSNSTAGKSKAGTGTGLGGSSLDAKASRSGSGSDAGASAADKKKNRSSGFFGKIKDKLKH